MKWIVKTSYRFNNHSKLVSNQFAIITVYLSHRLSDIKSGICANIDMNSVCRVLAGGAKFRSHCQCNFLITTLKMNRLSGPDIGLTAAGMFVVNKPMILTVGAMQCTYLPQSTSQRREVVLIARFMGPTWGSSGADRTQVGPMLVPWTLLSGVKTKLVRFKKTRTVSHAKRSQFHREICITDYLIPLYALGKTIKTVPNQMGWYESGACHLRLMTLNKIYSCSERIEASLWKI